MIPRTQYFFAQESFCVQGILDDINEQDTSFLDCKHKHMTKSGTPPEKFGVLYHMVTHRRVIEGLSLFGS